MEEVRTIQQSARAAVAALEATGTAPVNPFEIGSAGHKAWALAFYERSLEVEKSA